MSWDAAALGRLGKRKRTGLLKGRKLGGALQDQDPRAAEAGRFGVFVVPVVATMAIARACVRVHVLAAFPMM